MRGSSGSFWQTTAARTQNPHVMGALLLLDLDNTLADRERAFLVWARSKAQEWAPNEPDAVAYLVEQDDDGLCPRPAFFATACERFGLQHPVEALVAEFRGQLVCAFPPVPDDVIARVRELRSDGWRIAVVTNGGAAMQRAKLDHLGLPPLLDACCISGELGFGKPDPRIFEVAASRCGEDLADAWMVGDAEVDILGARRAGIRSVWLHRGRTWARSDVEPDHTAGGLLEALALLDPAGSRQR